MEKRTNHLPKQAGAGQDREKARQVETSSGIKKSQGKLTQCTSILVLVGRYRKTLDAKRRTSR
jgi:hypothetical protein